MDCPNCATDNIPGTDVCESCGSDLAGLDLPEAGRGFRGKLMTDRLADLGITEPLTVPVEATVAHAISKMRDAGQGCVLVVRGEELVGLFNERHVLTRVLRKGLDPTETPVSQVMSLDLSTLSPEDPPAVAIHSMVVHGFRHLPVVSDGEIRGVISVRNILSYLNRDVLGG